MNKGQINTVVFILLTIALLVFKFSMENDDRLFMESINTTTVLSKATLVRHFIGNFTNCSTQGLECELYEACNRSIWSSIDNGPNIRWTRDITNKLMNATTANIIDFKKIPLIKGLKNPCFGVQNGNILDDLTAEYAIFNGVDVYCLPYFFLIGFPKSSTSYFYSTLRRHKQIQSTYCFEDYLCPMKQTGSEPVKIEEPNWWDNSNRQSNNTFQKYTGLFTIAKQVIVKSFIHSYVQARCQIDECNLNEQVIAGDFSTYTAWAAETWQDEEINQGSPEPVVLTPHKIHKILPNSKLIVLMRNPTDRLYSGYNFRTWANKNRSAQDFHMQCKKAIKWWFVCTKSLGLSERHCAFGTYYPRILKDINNFSDNISEQIKIDPITLEDQVEVIENYKIPVRIRIGLYIIYLKEWLSVFPRSSFMFLNYQTFISDPIGTLQDKVYPFLDLPFIRQPTVPREMDYSHYSPMLPQTKEMLDEFYKPYNKQLSALLNDDTYLWES